MKRVLIQFPSDRPYDYYTRVFWFAEDLYSRIVTAGLGQMNDIDRARDLLFIDVASKHDLGTVKKIVQKAIGKAFPLEDVTVTVTHIEKA
jgi:hypothetical protein